MLYDLKSFGLLPRKFNIWKIPFNIDQGVTMGTEEMVVVPGICIKARPRRAQVFHRSQFAEGH